MDPFIRSTLTRLTRMRYAIFPHSQSLDFGTTHLSLIVIPGLGSAFIMYDTETSGTSAILEINLKGNLIVNPSLFGIKRASFHIRLSQKDGMPLPSQQQF